MCKGVGWGWGWGNYTVNDKTLTSLNRYYKATGNRSQLCRRSLLRSTKGPKDAVGSFKLSLNINGVRHVVAVWDRLNSAGITYHATEGGINKT